MKTILFTLTFFILTNSVNSQQQIIKYPGYTSYWNPKTLIPDSVLWMCVPHKKAVDREAGFHSTGNRVNQKRDYSHSGYDIGHNADASDLNGSKEDEYSSFDFANAFPQLPNCNRLTWLAIENYCRKIAPCKVKVSWQGTKGKLGQDSITIPLFCIKEIWKDSAYEKYVVPNTDSVNLHPFTYYKTN